jgi:hypothetical protein
MKIVFCIAPVQLLLKIRCVMTSVLEHQETSEIAVFSSPSQFMFKIKIYVHKYLFCKTDIKTWY